VSIPSLLKGANYIWKTLKQRYMPEMHRPSKKTVVSLWPLNRAENRFIGRFSEAISEQGYIVRDFQWSSLGLERTNFVFLHWPDDFFVNKGRFGIPKSFFKLAIIQIARILWGAKFIWVAHNAVPHDAAKSTSARTQRFLRSLDGIVFLSEYSRSLINRLYPEIRNCNALVTVHGHYRGATATRETPSTVPTGDIKLVHFGQIRPYKNLEVLVDVVSSISSGIHLLVAGIAIDRSLCAAIQERSRPVTHIKLDFRDAPIGDAELEAIVDSADAVVLPYKNVLNSGAALLSLSRNRPVLAPNMGSLPELQDAVGSDWVYLYDGEFSRQVLLDFREWMLKTKRVGVAPLDAYEWSRIGQALHDFIEVMRGQMAGVRERMSILR
jgi:beta-1,4-mannosyltransferase